MSSFAHHMLKKFYIFIHLLLCVGSLHGAEYSIIDPESLISDELKKEISKSQELALKEVDNLVSYAFYNVDTTKLATRMQWESNLKKAAEDSGASDKFHLLICVGVFSKQNTVDIFYKNPPSLEDVNELNTCIVSMKQSLGSEPNINKLIKNAPRIVMDQLTYLNERPKYEDEEKSAAEETRNQEFINYVLRLAKIALIAIGLIIAFLISWYMFICINNRKPHHFPISPNKSTKRRFDAPFAASSISKNNK